jgi:Uma2 family endonuclease
MATSIKLTYEQFLEQFGREDRSYEYWYGEAVAKGTPTWLHGLIQGIIVQLLKEAGWIAASEVELRIDIEARPRPDVIAVKHLPSGPYQTESADVVVEILSEDDKMQRVREKCRKYAEWGCRQIYVVDPSDKSVSEWRDGSLIQSNVMAGCPVERLWLELSRLYSDQ